MDHIRVLQGLLGAKNNMSINRTLCRLMDGIEGGIFLQECIYWSGATKDKDGWFWVDPDHWQREYFLSMYQINRHLKACKKLKFMESKRKKVNNAPRLHMRLNVEKLCELIIAFLDYQNFDNGLSIFRLLKFLESMDYQNFDNPIYKDLVTLIVTIDISSDEEMQNGDRGASELDSSKDIAIGEKATAAVTESKPTLSDEEKQIRSEMRLAMCYMTHKHKDLKSLTATQAKAINAEIGRIRKNERGYTVEHMRFWWNTIWAKDWRNKQAPSAQHFQSARITDIRAGIAQAYEEMNGEKSPEWVDTNENNIRNNTNGNLSAAAAERQRQYNAADRDKEKIERLKSEGFKLKALV